MTYREINDRLIKFLVNWVAMNPSKALPSDCHVGGYEKSSNYDGPLYIGRKQIGNELVIGKVIDSWKKGYCETAMTLLR